MMSMRYGSPRTALSFIICHLAVSVALCTSLAGCIDFDDATQPVTVAIQVTPPQDYQQASLQGHQVTLSGNRSYTAVTDADGVAQFQDIVPDVYNASVSWKVTADEYAQATGRPVENKSYTVSGSLTALTFAAPSQQPVAMATAISQDQSILISKVYYQGCKDDNNKNYT